MLNVCAKLKCLCLQCLKIFLKKYVLLQIFFGDVSARKELVKQLQCHDLDWYLENVYPEKYVPEFSNESYGRVSVNVNVTIVVILAERSNLNFTLLYTGYLPNTTPYLTPMPKVMETPNLECECSKIKKKTF